MDRKSKEDVYCTLVMDDGYLPGAAVLAKSLRDAGTQKTLACMVVQENLRASTLRELQSLYNHVIPVAPISSPNTAALYLMGRPDLRNTFTKIHLWRLTQYRRIVYVDADVVALRAPDELFDIHDDFAAAPDVGFPDIFNTGVLSLAPDAGVFEALLTMAATGDSFDGADQGLLNQYFEHKPWKRLSFTYNCTPNANYQYEPAYRYYKRNISMVHFIGSEKPWKKERSRVGSSGAYQELLNRWWAVYDRHFRVSTSDYIHGQTASPSFAVRREVRSASESDGYYATGYPSDSTQPAPPPEAATTATEAPFTEPGEQAENIDQGKTEPTPTVEVRRFSAPHMEWDATRSAPPVQSKPEAANFPTAVYEFSKDPVPFKPPQSYPEPPRDMHYEVPKPAPRKEEKLAPIFPWEEREAPKPTRRFIEDEPPPPSIVVQSEEDDFHGADELSVQALPTDETPPTSTALRGAPDGSWDPFDAGSKNAWDDVAGIEQYVRALSAQQKSRGQVQVLAPTTPPRQQQQTAAQASVLSPLNETIAPDDLVQKVQKRRESLLLTDFPTAIERPSLPVTPAPIRRSTFWSGENEGEDQLPPAEGVPSQEEWDPAVQLEQLRRNSLIGVGDLKLPGFAADKLKTIPERQMPGAAPSRSTTTTMAFKDDVFGVGSPGSGGVADSGGFGGGGSSWGLGLSLPTSTTTTETSQTFSSSEAFDTSAAAENSRMSEIFQKSNAASAAAADAETSRIAETFERADESFDTRSATAAETSRLSEMSQTFESAQTFEATQTSETIESFESSTSTSGGVRFGTEFASES